MSMEILNMRDLGKAVRMERKARGLTQSDLAKNASVTRQTIIHIENGNDSSSFTLMKILRSMGCCFEMRPIAPDFTQLGRILDES